MGVAKWVLNFGRGHVLKSDQLVDVLVCVSGLVPTAHSLYPCSVRMLLGSAWRSIICWRVHHGLSRLESRWLQQRENGHHIYYILWQRHWSDLLSICIYYMHCYCDDSSAVVICTKLECVRLGFEARSWLFVHIIAVVPRVYCFVPLERERWGDCSLCTITHTD